MGQMSKLWAAWQLMMNNPRNSFLTLPILSLISFGQDLLENYVLIVSYLLDALLKVKIMAFFPLLSR